MLFQFIVVGALTTLCVTGLVSVYNRHIFKRPIWQDPYIVNASIFGLLSIWLSAVFFVAVLVVGILFSVRALSKK